MDIEQSAKNRLLTNANNVFNLRNMADSLASDSGSFIGLTLVSLKTFVMASEKFRAVDIDIHILERAFREDINTKKTFSFGHCPNHLTPPPDPNSGNLVLFFGRQKRRFARMTEIFFDDDNDGFNDNYDDNFGNFDDNDKND